MSIRTITIKLSVGQCLDRCTGLVVGQSYPQPSDPDPVRIHGTVKCIHPQICGNMFEICGETSESIFVYIGKERSSTDTYHRYLDRRIKVEGFIVKTEWKGVSRIEMHGTVIPPD